MSTDEEDEVINLDQEVALQSQGYFSAPHRLTLDGIPVQFMGTPPPAPRSDRIDLTKTYLSTPKVIGILATLIAVTATIVGAYTSSRFKIEELGRRVQLIEATEKELVSKDNLKGALLQVEGRMEADTTWKVKEYQKVFLDTVQLECTKGYFSGTYRCHFKPVEK